MIIFYDTETTGLPIWDKPSSQPGQPHIVQICALLTDDDGNKQALIDLLIRPQGWTIDENGKAFAAHSITNAQALAGGVPVAHALGAFFDLWRLADLTVAYNKNFDQRMVRIEIARSPTSPRFPSAGQWKEAKSFCPMNAAKAIVKCPPTDAMMKAGRNSFKPPKLSEAYEHFMGKPLIGAHDAQIDVYACRDVYFKLKERGHLK